jgi:hypothetical protein
VQGVEEDAEGEREETLRDPLGEAARCLGEVPLQPHLLFEVREDALDHQTARRERAFASGVIGGSLTRRGEEPHLDALHPFAVGATPEALVGDHGLSLLDQVEQRLVLVFVRWYQRVAER